MHADNATSLQVRPAAPPMRPSTFPIHPGFSNAERRVLLATRGIGQGVVERIEWAGVHSLRQLRELGVDTVVDRICDGVGNFAWRNRKRALLRALAAVAALSPDLRG